MKKLNSIDTISIKKINGFPTIRINGLKATPYDINGASFLASEIEAVPVNDLGYFNPIFVEFDEPCIKTSKLNHIRDYIVVSLTIMDDSLVDAFITFVYPPDIYEKGLHEDFQTKLEKVVESEQNIQLFDSVRQPISKKELKALKRAMKESGDSNSEFSYSDVGYTQFSVQIKAETFNDVFRALNRIISRLEKSTRSLIKKKNLNK